MWKQAEGPYSQEKPGITKTLNETKDYTKNWMTKYQTVIT